METPIIYLITVCRDEEEILPHFFNYYEKYVNRFFVFYNIASIDNSKTIIDAHPKATRINYDTRGELRDDINMLIKNSVWHEWKNEADWIIAVDNDEFLYHPDGLSHYLNICSNDGITIPRTKGFDMISDDFPRVDQNLLDLVQFGVPNKEFSKPAVFNCREITQINYIPGSHVCHPEGRIEYSSTAEIKLLHFKYLGGLERLKKRWNATGEHLSSINKINRWGWQRMDENEIVRRYNHTYKNKRNVYEIESQVAIRKIDIVNSSYEGIPVIFTISHREDHIQQFHLKGEFYEKEELEIIKSYIPDNATIMDCGANIGNHILFFSLVCNAKKIAFIEPNPLANEILELNLRLNNIYERTLLEPYRNIALSNSQNQGRIEFGLNNIGGAVIKLDPDGDIKIKRGDQIFDNCKFDFIKIDTEDQDIECLLGLTKTIVRSKCPVFVEIIDARKVLFIEILNSINYHIEFEIKNYPKRTNYLILADN